MKSLLLASTIAVALTLQACSASPYGQSRTPGYNRSYYPGGYGQGPTQQLNQQLSQLRQLKYTIDSFKRW